MSAIRYPRAIRNFNAFENGISYAGRVTEATLPEPKIQVANHRGGGMDAPGPRDAGMEALSCELTFMEWPPRLITILGTRTKFVLRPTAHAMVDTTDVDTFIFTLRGLVTTPGFGNLKPGDDTPMKVGLSLDYYECELNGTRLFKLDVEKGIREIGGVDQMGELRRAMGL